MGLRGCSWLHDQRVLAAVGILSLTLAACGGTPSASDTSPSETQPPGVGDESTGSTSPQGERTTPDTGGETQAAPASECDDGRVPAVVAEVEGLEGEERTQRLVELAEEAGGTVSLYTVLTTDIAEQVDAAFTERFGLDLELYRARSESVSQRLLQEVAAGSPGADVVESGAAEVIVFAREGALAPYESPQREALIDAAVVDDEWTGSRVALFLS